MNKTHREALVATYLYNELIFKIIIKIISPIKK